MIAGAAGDDVHAAGGGEQRLAVDTEDVRQHAVRADARLQRVGHRARLLEDFLLHVVAVFAAFDRVGGQLALVHLALDRRAVQREHLHAVAGDLDHVVLVEVEHAVGDLDQRLRIGAEEVLADADAHQQRRAAARTDHAVGLLAAEHGDRIGALQFTHGGQHRLAQVLALADASVDQRGHHLGVGFRSEHVAGGLQLGAQAGVVLDDAVVHDRHPAGDVRVRVRLVRHAMRGPAGMRDAGAAGQRVGQVQRLHLAHLALGAHAEDRAVVEHGHAGGVVAPVFERFQAGDKQRGDIALGYGGNDSTHGEASFGSGPGRPGLF